MSHQLRAALSAACLLIIPATLTACDEDAHGSGWNPEPAMSNCPQVIPLAPPPGLDGESDDLEFREAGPPKSLVLDKWQGKPIRRSAFQAIVGHCAKQVDPDLYCSLSWYEPDTSKDEVVGGLGCSSWVTPALLKCYRDAFLANGAQAG